MNENNRSNYINAPARGKQLQQQRETAQYQYMQNNTPQGGYQQSLYARQQAEQLRQQGMMPQQNAYGQGSQQGWGQTGYHPAQQGYGQTGYAPQTQQPYGQTG